MNTVIEPPCPLCQGHAKKVRSFSQRGEERLNLQACKDCRVEFLQPQPSEDWLSEEYSQYYQRRSGTEPSRSKVDYFRGLFRSLFQSLNTDLKGKRIIDLGTGEGDSLLALQQMAPTAQLFALEANAEAEEYLQNLGVRARISSLEDWLGSVEGEKYDVICLFDLLEHLRDPLAALQKLQDRLEPGGLLVMTFPVADSHSRRLWGPLWPQYKVEHLFYFSDLWMDRVLKKTNYKEVHRSRLKKTLALDYLLRVGSGFGPKPSRNFCRGLLKLTPSGWLKARVPMYYGERLWVLRPSQTCN